MKMLKRLIALCFAICIIHSDVFTQDGRIGKDEILEKGIKSVKTDYLQVSQQGKLAKIKAEKFVYDAKGNLIGRIEYNGDDKPLTSTHIRYDEQGNQIHQKLEQYQEEKNLEVSWENIYRDGKLVEVRNSNTPAIKTFEYDQAGRVIAQKDIDANGKIFGLKNYEYDERGNLIRQKELLDFLEREFVYLYNEDNQKTRTLFTRKNTFEGGEETTEMEDYSYNTKGDLAKTVYRDRTGKITSFSQFYYNKSGKLIKEERGETQYLYKYDDKGNLIEKKKTIKGNVQLVEKIIYEF